CVSGNYSRFPCASLYAYITRHRNPLHTARERKMYVFTVCGFLLLQHTLWFAMTEAAGPANLTRASRIKRAPLYSCGGALLAGWGNITSPDFPMEYPQHARCHWTVEPRDLSRAILLSFESFDVESDRVCSYDSLFVIRDKAENSTYCNGNEPPPEGLVGRHFDLTFRSDGYQQHNKGFLISYSPVDNLDSTTVSTVALGKTWAQRPTEVLKGTTDEPPTTARLIGSMFTVTNKGTYTDRNIYTRNDSNVPNTTVPFTTQQLLYTTRTPVLYNTTSPVFPTPTHWPKHHTNNTLSVTHYTHHAVHGQSTPYIQNVSTWITDAPTVASGVSTDRPGNPELSTVPSRMFTAKETIVGGIVIGLVPLSCAVVLLALYLRRTRERDSAAAIIQAITFMDETIIKMEESVASEEAEKDDVQPPDSTGELRGHTCPGGGDNTPDDMAKSVDTQPKPCQDHASNGEASSPAVSETQLITKDAVVQSAHTAATCSDEWMSYHPISNKMKINVKHEKVNNRSSLAGNDRPDETERERIQTNGQAASPNDQHRPEGDRAAVSPTPREELGGTTRDKAKTSRGAEQVKEMSRMFKDDEEDELCRCSSLPRPMLHSQPPGKLSTDKLGMFDSSLGRSNSSSSSDTSLNCLSFEDGSKLCREWSFSTIPLTSCKGACGGHNKCRVSNSEGLYGTPRRLSTRGYPDGKEDVLSKKLDPPLPAKVYQRNVYTKTTVSDKVSLPNGDIEEHVTVSSEEDYTSLTSHDSVEEDVSISIHHKTTEIVKLFDGGRGSPEVTELVDRYRTFDEKSRSTIERQTTTEKRSFPTSPKQGCSKATGHQSEHTSATLDQSEHASITQTLTQDTGVTQTPECKNTTGDSPHAETSKVVKKVVKFKFPPSREQLLEQKSRLRKVVVPEKARSDTGIHDSRPIRNTSTTLDQSEHTSTTGDQSGHTSTTLDQSEHTSTTLDQSGHTPATLDQSEHASITQTLTQDTGVTQTPQYKHTTGDSPHAETSKVVKKVVKFKFPPSREQLLEQKSRLRKVVVPEKGHKKSN
ncbi:PREDICTED: uncharacterized protein LOC109478420, partial [Branchiostoma belcheri]|uniref:Uncharacterized protein LOC109478420 n=1 Tax=Branchiostoma belcheri TaxID=7741 RepID=A0A6P4ZND1_BRABE